MLRYESKYRVISDNMVRGFNVPFFNFKRALNEFLLLFVGEIHKGAYTLRGEETSTHSKCGRPGSGIYPDLYNV